MRSWLAIPLIALALSACGGDDSSDTVDTTTSTTASTSSTVTSVTASAERVATPHALAYIAVQLDDKLRAKVTAAEPCLNDRLDQCVGGSLDAYRFIDDLSGAVITFLTSSTTKGDPLYAGETPDALIGRMDATMNAAAAVKEHSEAAQTACLPTKRDSCLDETRALNGALADLYKLLNEWRADL